MEQDKQIELWAQMSKRLNGPIFESEDEGFDWGSVIGTFTVKSKSLSEMGSIGSIDYLHKFVVYVHPDEGMIPHFHVFDKEGRNKRKAGDPGIHTCVEIKHSRYFRHSGYMDKLDKATRQALDRFMSEIRSSPKYRSDLGCTNFTHMVNQWDDNNAEAGSPNWVDPEMLKPDYSEIEDNI